MRDDDRFAVVLDITDDIEHTEERNELREQIDILRIRFEALRELAHKCVTEGWTARDLQHLRNWITIQQDDATILTGEEELVIQAIGDLLAVPPELAAPQPAEEPQDAPPALGGTQQLTDHIDAQMRFDQVINTHLEVPRQWRAVTPRRIQGRIQDT